MIKNCLMRLLLLPVLLALHLGVHGAAFAAEEDVSRDDPPRWYQADQTPTLHYKNLLKEARAAYAQSLQECKQMKNAEARACRKEARGHYKSDKARAKRILQILRRGI